MARIQGWISKVTIHDVCRWRLALLLHLWASEETNGTDYAFWSTWVLAMHWYFLTPCLANLRHRSGFCYPLQQGFTRLMSWL